MALSKLEIKDLISNNLQSGTKITATKHREVENALVEVIFDLVTNFNDFVTTEALPYEVREIDMPNDSIGLYFEMGGSSPGRGKVGVFSKWAICNGYNGTRPRAGKTPIGYGGGYILGATGGSETHTLNESEIPALNLTITPSTDDSTQGTTDYFLMTDRNSTTVKTVTDAVNSTGGGQPHSNMQPYIVTLFIQRIPTGF
jgi:hypothetical protein